MSRVTAAIVHHPARAERIPRLLDRLGHPDRVRVVTDHNSEGVWPTARRAWETGLALEGTHHLVLQDDTLVCADLLPALDQITRILPGEIIAPYANRKAITEALVAGKHWARIADGVWGQAILMPTAFIPAFLGWVDVNVREDYKHDDRRVSFWLAAIGRDAYATAPSLVEHDAPGDSLLSQSNSNRVARHFIGEGERALRINWARGARNAARSGTPMRVPEKCRV